MRKELLPFKAGVGCSIPALISLFISLLSLHLCHFHLNDSLRLCRSIYTSLLFLKRISAPQQLPTNQMLLFCAYGARPNPVLQNTASPYIASGSFSRRLHVDNSVNPRDLGCQHECTKCTSLYAHGPRK